MTGGSVRTSLFYATLAVAILATPVGVLAAGAIAQGFTADSTDIVQGTLVSIVSGTKSSVVPAAPSSAARLVGVASTKPLVELSNSASASVQIVTGGVTDALVSNANGPVLAGDKITISPVSGIGMKATASAEIIGVAQADLASVKSVSESVQSTTGKSLAISVGLVPVAISVGYFSAESTAGTISSFVPPVLQNLANAIAGRSVSPWRVLSAALALLLGFGMAAVMLITAIRNGLISVGRNPLARGSLLRALMDVIIASLGVLAVTVVAVYLLLTTFTQ
jgi:hypothetical protein